MSEILHTINPLQSKIHLILDAKIQRRSYHRDNLELIGRYSKQNKACIKHMVHI